MSVEPTVAGEGLLLSHGVVLSDTGNLSSN